MESEGGEPSSRAEHDPLPYFPLTSLIICLNRIMRSHRVLASLLILVSISCKTKLLVVGPSNFHGAEVRSMIVVPSTGSYIFPASVYPLHDQIDGFVLRTVPPIYRIDSLICAELGKKNVVCTINAPGGAITEDAYSITYKDYWSWDFRRYMHVLKIYVFDRQGNCVIEVVSQGNTSGMHDYPRPEKQVPGLINLLLEQ